MKIYLIDDKKNRQKEDFGWTDGILSLYKDILYPIYNVENLQEISKDIFKENNIVLYHESFLDKSDMSKDAAIRREKLEAYGNKWNSFRLVIFSGSKNNRVIKENIGYLPVSVVYQNLKTFIEKCKAGNVDLNYLAFGENPKIESELINRLHNSLQKIENEPAIIPKSKNIFITPNINDIRNPIEGAKIVTLFEEESDVNFSDFIDDNLDTERYDNVFIPVCFGQTLSDYHGLRLASHIRCTKSKNQLSRIFLYCFVEMNYLFQNDYFNILKTKNIYFVEFSKKAFELAGKNQFEPLNYDELPREVSKLKLLPPKNYDDSHSINNEWSIYRWATAINKSDNEIEQIIKKVNTQLYFKYLSTIYPKEKVNIINEKNLKIEYSGNPKILFIDDEAEKGWYKIFRKILFDINNLDFQYLDEEFNSKTQDEIVNISIDKIKSENIDMVILDFRLHPDDFRVASIQEVTGLKLLKKIKKLNFGIQVIIFSATNKVWNLQALQDAGADGFIIKESPENSIDSDSTLKAIYNFISVLNNCFEKTFLKDFYIKLEVLKTVLIPRKNFNKSNIPLPKEFVDETLKWFELSCEVLKKETSQSMITASFIFMFSVLENISNRLINVDDPIPIEGNNNQQLFMFEFRGSNQKLKRFQEDKNNIGYFIRMNGHLKTTRNISWKFKILNALDFITDNKMKEDELSILIKKRNDLIHANATTGDKFTINIDLLITLNSIIYNGLINVK